MAAHTTCFDGNVVDRILSSPKPEAREYSNFLRSEYEANPSKKKFDPSTVHVVGRCPDDFLQDDVPILRNPVPTVTSLTQNYGSDLDPSLLITPEKYSPVKTYQQHPDFSVTSEHSIPRKTLYSSAHIQPTRSVRFDQNVEVCELSPLSSVVGTPSPDRAQSNSDSTISMDQNSSDITDSPATSQELNYNQYLKCDDVKTGSHPNVKSSRLHKPHHKYSGSLSSNSFSSCSDGGLDSLSSQGSGTDPETVETVDVIASDLKSVKRVPGMSGNRYTTVKKDARDRTVFNVPGGGEPSECVLNRPEFSSTLRVRKELTDLQKSEIDVDNAVKTKLKTSEKAKAKLAEKVYSRVNQEDFQFGDLPGIEVKEDDLYFVAEVTQTSKAKPTTKKTQNKPESKLKRVPDVMDFFERRLQRETSSFSLPATPTFCPTSSTVKPEAAFDVYQRIRAWENW